MKWDLGRDHQLKKPCFYGRWHHQRGNGSNCYWYSRLRNNIADDGVHSHTALQSNYASSRIPEHYINSVMTKLVTLPLSESSVLYSSSSSRMNKLGVQQGPPRMD